MALTIKTRDGKADVTSVSPTGTQVHLLYGPPPSGRPNCRGVYIAQVAGTNGTYRFIEEQWTPGVASPATWTYAALS